MRGCLSRSPSPASGLVSVFGIDLQASHLLLPPNCWCLMQEGSQAAPDDLAKLEAKKRKLWKKLYSDLNKYSVFPAHAALLLGTLPGYNI